MTKQYDWFAASLFQKDLSTDDFYDLGITPDNSEIKSKDSYKNIPEVIEAFSENGKFDDNAFDTFYNNALSSYNKYAKSEFDKKILENYEWDPEDWMAPIGANTRDVSSKFALGNNNPTKIEIGIEGLGISSESQFSNRELAQANEVRDEFGKKLGYTPNDQGGWFKSLSRPTLVLAQYDEDTVEIINGHRVIHKKGELKLDEYGVPYYEELGDREVYGRDVLHYTDTLTTDGSKWNKYDFFDSDGLDKSIGGTIVKTAFKIAPYFIPYVNYAWGAVNAGMEIAQLLPTLGKAVNGMITNNENTSFNKGLTKWESYLERFESSVSDHSRDKMVTTENFGNLVADISGQLWQQRVVGSIPKLLEKTKLLESGSKNIKLGQNLALTYMAGTSAKETYGSFKEAGASDRTAGLAMIGNMIALNKLMQNDYFKSAIFRGGYLDEDSVKRPAWGVAKMFKDALSEVNEEVATEVGKKKFLSKVTNAFTHSIIPGLQKSEFVRASISEGVEETMEEAIADISKAFTEGLNAIGIRVTKPNTELNFGWSLEDIAGRYAMAFAGGTIGGALFQANHAWETRNVPKFIKEMDNNDMAKFTYLIAEGRGNEIREYYKKLHDKGLLGDSNLSASKLRTTTGIKGVDEVIAESAEKGGSQNDYVYQSLLRQVDYIENILQDERFAYPEETIQAMAMMGIEPKDEEEAHLLKAQILNLASINSGFFNEFNRLATRTVKVRSELESLYADAEKGETDAERKANADKVKSNQRVKELTEELKDLRKQRDEILEGKRNWYFVGQGLFVLDEGSNRGFLTTTKDKFAQLMFNKTTGDLTDYEKERLEEEWSSYKNTAEKQNAYRAYDVYLKLAELYKADFEEAGKRLKSKKSDSIHDSKINFEKFTEKQKEGKKVLEELEKLNKKENKTESDQTKIDELLEQLAVINAELSEMQQRTGSILRGDVKGELENFSELNQDRDSLEIAFNYIKSLYTDFASKRNVMRSEDELHEFYRLVRGNKLNSEPMVRRWNSYMAMWMSDPDLVDQNDPETSMMNVNKDPNNELLTQGEDQNNPLQQALISILQDLENAIGVDPNTVNAKLQEAVAFIMQHTNLNEQQATKVVKSVLAKVGQQSLLDVSNEIEDLRKQVTFSPVYELLKKFKAGYSNGTLTIEDLLNEEVNRLANSGKLSDYVISSKQVVEELKEAMQLLQVIKALINGSNSGLNKAINVMRKKQGLDSIVELDEAQAKLLGKDIDFILQRITHLLSIAASNANKKLKVHKESEIKLKPLTLKCLTDPEFADGFKKLDVDVNDLWEKISQKHNVDLRYVNESNWSDFEAARIEFESELYHAVWSKNNGDISKKLIECFGKNLYKMKTTKIDPETNTISGYDLLWDVADILSMDSVAYHSRYRNVLQNSKLAPVYGQELAVRRNICMSLNPELYNGLLREIYGQYPDTIGKKSILPNVSVVYGGAGTGKTVAVSAISAEMMSFDDDVEFIYLAPSENQAKNLKKNVGKEGTVLTSKDLDGFFEKKPKFDYEYETLPDGKKGNKTGTITWEYTLNNNTLWKGNKKRKVLIVDESSLIDGARWEALAKIAINEGGVIWALGDGKQNSSLVKMPDNIMQHTGLEDFTIVKSPELTTALRPSVVGKFDNAMMMDAMLSEINAKATDADARSLGDYDAITNTELIELNLKSYENPETGEVFGEKFITGTEEEVNMYLKRFAKLGSVAYITDKDVTVPDGVENIKAHAAQGGEWDYVVIDKNWNLNSKYDSLRDLYTLTQRSTKGTIIVDKGVVKALNIVKNSTATAAEPMELNSQDLAEFVEWKKNALGGYVEDYPFAEAFKLKYDTDGDDGAKDNDSDDKPEDKPEEEKKPEAGTPPVDPEEEKKSDDGEPEKENPADADESKEDPDSAKESEGTPPPPPVLPPPIDTTVDEDDESVEEDKPEVKPTSKPTNPNAVRTNEGDFFNMIFNKQYWTESSNQDDSLMKMFGLTEEECMEVAFLLSGAIKARSNKDSKINVNFTNIFSGDNAEDKLFELNDFISNCRLELNIVPGSKTSIMYGTFVNDGTKQAFTIPVCVVSGTITGKYNGTFTLKSKPKKKKGKWITLSELKTKYPWLRVFSRWQVISGNTTRINERTDLSDSTKKYLTQNMGKVMTLVSDNPYLTDLSDSDRVYSLAPDPKHDGMFYTHDGVDNFTQMGIISTAPLSQVLQYSFLWSQKLNLIQDIPPVTVEGDTDAWLREMIGTNVLPDKNFGDRRWQILSANNCMRLLAKVFNLATTDVNPRLVQLIGYSLVQTMQHEDHKVVKRDSKTKKTTTTFYRTGLQINSGENSYWVEFDMKEAKYKVFEYYLGSKSVGKLIESIPLETGKFPFKQLQSIIGKFDTLQVFSRKFDKDKKQIAIYPQYVSNQITSVFRDIGKENEYDELDKLLVDDDYFIKGKIFLNVAGETGDNAFMPNKLARHFVGQKAGYITDASEWTPSVYEIDGSNMIRSEQEDRDRLDFAEAIDDIKKVLSGVLDIRDILSQAQNVQNNYIDNLYQIVEAINLKLKTTSKDWKYKQLSFNGVRWAVSDISDFNGWIKEKTGIEGDVNFDFNAIDSFKFGVFSVSLQGFYMRHNGSEWEVQPMKSYATFKPMLEYWNTNKDVLSTFIPNFEQYLSNLYGQSSTINRETSLALNENAKISTIVSDMQNLVIEHLKERINEGEC